MGMPIHVCIHFSLQIGESSAIRKTQRRIQSGHTVRGLVEPAVRPDLSLMASWGYGILDSGPGVSLSAKTRPTPLFALQDICRERTEG